MVNYYVVVFLVRQGSDFEGPYADIHVTLQAASTASEG